MTVARPVGVIPTIRTPSQRKCSRHASRRGSNNMTSSPVCGSTVAKRAPFLSEHELTGLLATTLVGKVYEGWDCMGKAKFQATLDELSMPEQLKHLKKHLSERLSGKLFLRIRQQAFHYSEKAFDFSKFKGSFGDQDTQIHVTAAGYRGDILSRISALGRVYALCNLAHLVDGDSDVTGESKFDVLVAYRRVLDEVVEVTGLYCEFVSDVLTTLMNHAFAGKITFKPFIVRDAPEAQAERVHFFLHPPSDLQQIRSELPTPVPKRDRSIGL
jgi:hypothetical protein